MRRRQPDRAGLSQPGVGRCLDVRRAVALAAAFASWAAGWPFQAASSLASYRVYNRGQFNLFARRLLLLIGAVLPGSIQKNDALRDCTCSILLSRLCCCTAGGTQSARRAPRLSATAPGTGAKPELRSRAHLAIIFHVCAVHGCRLAALVCAHACRKCDSVCPFAGHLLAELT